MIAGVSEQRCTASVFEGRNTAGVVCSITPCRLVSSGRSDDLETPCACAEEPTVTCMLSFCGAVIKGVHPTRNPQMWLATVYIIVETEAATGVSHGVATVLFGYGQYT